MNQDIHLAQKVQIIGYRCLPKVFLFQYTPHTGRDWKQITELHILQLTFHYPIYVMFDFDFDLLFKEEKI
jgi:hypothetical protein